MTGLGKKDLRRPFQIFFLNFGPNRHFYKSDKGIYKFIFKFRSKLPFLRYTRPDFEALDVDLSEK